MSLGYHEVEKGSVREQMMLPAPTRYLHVVGNGLLHCPPVSPLPPLRQLFELESPFLLTPWHLKSSVHSRLWQLQQQDAQWESLRGPHEHGVLSNGISLLQPARTSQQSVLPVANITSLRDPCLSAYLPKASGRSQEACKIYMRGGQAHVYLLVFF